VNVETGTPDGSKKLISLDGLVQISFPPNGQANFAEACANLALLRAQLESEKADLQRRKRALALELRQAEFSELCISLQSQLGVRTAGLAAVFAALPDQHAVSFSECGRMVHQRPQDALAEVLIQMALDKPRR
jgi:hypothetical protein